MLGVLRNRLWVIVALGFSVSLGLVNRLVAVPRGDYFSRAFSHPLRELDFARRLAGSPPPLELTILLSFVGLACLGAGFAKFRFARWLNAVGFLAVLAAWTPLIALAAGLLIFFIILGWITSGMGVESNNRSDVLNADDDTPRDYRMFWRSIAHPSPSLYRTHLRWAFGICWFLALVLFVVYLSGDPLIRFPNAYDYPAPPFL